ncbi:MAG: dihydropteroate synthase [Dongiaceae bacterium]
MSNATTEPSPGPGEGFSYQPAAAPWEALEAALGAPDLTAYARPVGLLRGRDARAALEAGLARPLAGGPVAFAAVEVALRQGRRIARRLFPLDAFDGWLAGAGAAGAAGLAAAVARLAAPRPPFAGLPLDRPLVMGVVNVTPDSFSDGGDHADPAAAIARGRAQREAGADILDIGGESTRPGAAPLPAAEEAERIVPVIAALAGEGAVVSVDSRHAAVMAAALEAGARIVNDVTALAGDPASLGLVAARRCPAVLMHMRGDPATMQKDPRYLDAPLDLHDYLAERLACCRAAGIAEADLAVDPGIGFGKTAAHNLDLIDRLALLHGLGVPLLLGVSRKSFIGRLSRGEPPKQRLPGSLAAALAAFDRGCQIIRVHDVAETAQARALWLALGEV